MLLQIFTSGDYWDPASRIRGYYVGRALSRHKFTVYIYPYNPIHGTLLKRSIHVFKDFLLKILAIMSFRRTKPVIYIQRGINSVPLVSLFFVIICKYIFRRKVIYDIDDGLFLTHPFEINSILKLSDIVIAGGHELFRYCRNINSRVLLIPTSVDLSLYHKHEDKKTNENVTLGFVGSPATIRYLTLLLNPLRKLSKYYDYTLRIVAARTKEDYEKYRSLLKKLKTCAKKVETVPYSVEKEPEILRELDIGLAPLYEGAWKGDDWEKYKCGFKVINYMAAGIPPVASDYGEQGRIITDGYDGFLCRDEEDWFLKLSILLQDPERRRIMGENARKTAEAKYSLEKNIEKLEKIIMELLTEG